MRISFLEKSCRGRRGQVRSGNQRGGVQRAVWADRRQARLLQPTRANSLVKVSPMVALPPSLHAGGLLVGCGGSAPGVRVPLRLTAHCLGSALVGIEGRPAAQNAVLAGGREEHLSSHSMRGDRLPFGDSPIAASDGQDFLSRHNARGHRACVLPLPPKTCSTAGAAAQPCFPPPVLGGLCTIGCLENGVAAAHSTGHLTTTAAADGAGPDRWVFLHWQPRNWYACLPT